ncbi:helix-turn-helix transcriptional regulator [Kineococcus terrestris]|uniref:helix-turn-helix transcriptional regulator n=1 Tax=Kineococcus terrestris TaxID=2044856 RepID=UPI0034DAEA93
MSGTTARALELLGLLQTHRQWTGPELARRLGVTERTLRRDVERLRALGYRVTAARGAAGGYRLEAGGGVPPLLLTDAEAVTVAVGLRAAATQGLADGEHTTASALAKFEQVLPPVLRRRVNALAEHLQPAGPRGRPVPTDLLSRLALACRDHERVRFRYVSGAGRETRRHVEPHALVAEARHWFLVAHDLDRDAWRTFRLDRAGALEPTGVRFAPRPLPAAGAAELVARAVSGADRARVHADVHLDLPLERARARFGWWLRDAVDDGAGGTRWPLAVEHPEQVAAALLWIPEDVPHRLSAPPEVRAAVARAARRLLAHAEPPGRPGPPDGPGEPGGRPRR